jgi:WD40 repeat protein
MAKFLSEVTLSRLDSRREDTDRTNSETLVCLDEPVIGFIRCAQVAAVGVSSGSNSGRSTNRSVWCGEQDGAIVVRDLESQQATVVIERKPNTLVFSMCAPSENRLWTGLNDGHVRVFDTANYHLIEEFKAHCSAVTAMAVAHMPTHDDEYEHHMNVAVTCSADWTIAKWDAVSYQCLGRLQGHSNAVKCICPSVSGEYLVSGGMDGALRLWSLISNTEATAQRFAAATSPGDGRTPRRGSSFTPERAASSSVASSSSPSTEVASRTRHNLRPSDTAWPLLGLHADTVTCVLVVRDEYIVSGGSEGSVHLIAFDASGKWLMELERRPCAVTSLLHDPVNSRLWVAGVDGVISLYVDAFPDVVPLTRVHDHSGIYVMSLCPMERGNLFRFLVLDDEGQLTKFVESDAVLRTSTNYELGAVSQQETALTEEIDHHRDIIVRSYNELQSLRRELKAIEEYERRRKRGMTLKLGDDFQMKQFFTYRAMRWTLRQRFINITKLRCRWMEQSNERLVIGNRYAAWLLWFRRRRNERRKQALVLTMRVATMHKSKTDVAFALADAARRVESETKMRLFVSAMTSQSERGRILAAFAKWSAFALMSRHRNSQLAVARAVAQSVDDATGLLYWNRLVHAARERELIERKVRVVESVMHASGRGLLSLFFRQWAKETVARRRDGSTRRQQLARQIHCVQDEQLALDTYAARHALVLKYFSTWMKFRVDVQCRREVELADRADKEREMWEEVLAETSSAAQERTVKLADDIQRQVAERQEELAAQEAAIKTLRQELFETQRDLLCKGLRVPRGAGVREKFRSIMLYLKGRGVSTYADMSTIALAKDAFSAVPLVPPPEKAAAALSPARALSPVRGGAKPKPKAKAAAGPPKPPPATLGSSFAALLKRLRASLTAACKSVGLTPHGVDRGGGRVRSSSLLRREATKAQLAEIERQLEASEDWGILPGWVAKIRRKDQMECVDLVKQLVVLQDAIEAKLLEPAAQVASTQQAILAGGPPVPEAACVEFVYNSHAIVELSEVELQTRGALAEYVKQTQQSVGSSDPADPEPAAQPPPTATPAKVSARRPVSGSPVRPPSRAPSPKSTTPRRAAAASAAPPPSKPPAPATKTRSPTPSARKSVPAPSPQPAPAAVKSPSPTPAAKPSSPRSPPSAAVIPKPYVGFRVGMKKLSHHAVPKLVVEECSETFMTAAATSTDAAALVELPGPAYAAGLRVGDELMRFANYVVTDLASFNAIASRHVKIGQTIPVQFKREGTIDTAVVVVAAKKG